MPNIICIKTKTSMKERLIGFLKTYFLLSSIFFMLQKPLFMFFYQTLYEGASWTEWFRVIWHGLPLDLSLAGYLTAVPGLLFIGSAWGLSNLLRRIWCGLFYFCFCLTLCHIHRRFGIV